MKVTLALLALMTAVASAGRRVVCFGDSWAAFACDTLETVLRENLKFNDVENKGVAGSTAAFWAENTDALIALFAEADPDYLWVSLGGDDLLGGCANGSTPEQVYQALGPNLDKVLSEIFLAFPKVQASIFAYDLLNFEQSEVCQVLGKTYFPHSNLSALYINEAVMGLGNEVYKGLAAKHSQLTFLNLTGTLQTAEPQGIPAPYPNILYPSPANLMNDGCIHASKQGWLDIMGKLYSEWLAWIIQP